MIADIWELKSISQNHLYISPHFWQELFYSAGIMNSFCGTNQLHLKWALSTVVCVVVVAFAFQIQGKTNKNCLTFGLRKQQQQRQPNIHNISMWKCWANRDKKRKTVWQSSQRGCECERERQTARQTVIHILGRRRIATITGKVQHAPSQERRRHPKHSDCRPTSKAFWSRHWQLRQQRNATPKQLFSQSSEYSSAAPVVRSTSGPFILGRRGALCQALHTTYVPRLASCHCHGALHWTSTAQVLPLVYSIDGINLFKR